MSAVVKRITRHMLFVGGLSLASVGLAETACDSPFALGERQFGKCAACHSLEPGVHLMGPSLASLKGRKAGSVQGFSFSPAMARANRVWDRETLSDFLANPGASVPGNVMPFGGLRNPAQRDALVELLLASSPQIAAVVKKAAKDCQ